MITTYQRHLMAIESGEVTKTNIIGIRKALNHAARINAGWSGNRCNVTPQEAQTLYRAIETHKPIVTGTLHDSGIRVLRNPRYAKRWSDWQIAAINGINHFRLVGYWQEELHHYPIYELWAKAPPKGDGMDSAIYQSFRFINVPWQSGGNGPVVL